MKTFLPVEVVKNNQKEMWYLDITKLGISDLISLRQELIGTNEYSIIKLDGILYDEIGFCYNTRKSRNRENKKEREKIRIKKKFYSKKRHR